MSTWASELLDSIREGDKRARKTRLMVKEHRPYPPSQEYSPPVGHAD